MAYTPTSGLGIQLELLRYLFANSAALRTRMGADDVAEALTRIHYERPFQGEIVRPTVYEDGWRLPEVSILRPTQTARVFTGGIQPVAWPEAEHVVYMPFWPADIYHTGGQADDNDEYLEAIDFADKVFSEVRANAGRLDVTIGDTAYGTPGLVSESRMDVYNSLSEGIARDLKANGAEYDYFYFAYYQLRLQP